MQPSAMTASTGSVSSRREPDLGGEPDQWPIREDVVRLRAYFISLETGGQDPEADWLAAEAEFLAAAGFRPDIARGTSVPAGGRRSPRWPDMRWEAAAGRNAGQAHYRGPDHLPSGAQAASRSPRLRITARAGDRRAGLPFATRASAAEGTS